MASIQELADAALRIKDNATSVATRSTRCADDLGRHTGALASLVRGSKSGEEAVQQVAQAQRSIKQCASHMSSLSSSCSSFISAVTR